MSEPLRVDTDQYKALAKRLQGIEPELKKQVNASLRKTAIPVGKFVAVSAGRSLPQRGGLGYAVGGARPGVTATASRVSVRFNIRERWYLARIDDGTITHPVFGRKPNVDQKTPAGSFRRPFDESAPAVRLEVIKGLESMLNDLPGA